MEQQSIVTYEPDNSLKKGCFLIFREIISEIIANRWLTYQLFRRNFLAMYRQSFIGVLWIFILPIVNVSIFAILHNSGIFNFGDIQVPYPIYAICGMAFWQIFAVGLNACGSSLTAAGAMVTRINFSKKSLVIAPMGKTIISFFIQFILVGILFLYYRMMPNLGILLIPVVIFPIILLTLGLGFLVSLLNAIVRDMGNMLTLGTTFLMYLTPVLYAKPRIGILSHVSQYNPLYYLVSAGRDLAFDGQIAEINGFLYSVLFSVIVFVVSLVIFHLTETKITERI